MATRKFNEDEVLKALRKKNDCKIDTNLKTIKVLTNDAKSKRNDLGNGSWGKIDFLVKVHKYKQYMVATF